MIQQARDKVKKHIKTHSEHSVEDRAAISLLGTFLNPGGRINTSFAANDTWPNHDGTFEFISNPDVSRRPKQNFFVQIKGTSVYTEKDDSSVAEIQRYNNYFQAANTKGEAIPWAEWSYKVGDPILFNDSKRFDLLYNNLKGRIVDIEKHSGSISFTVDVEIPLTELMCKRDGIEFIESIENGTRIRFAVYEYDESKKGEDLDENLRLKSVVPFQLAYAVSIHKAQGLEYDSVKVIIPSNNAEKITHGIFYTAITRAKTNLKIYWSSETMHDVVKGFATDESKRKSLEIVKTKLGKN